MEYDKIIKKYIQYWDNQEIDVDLANELVDQIPKLIAQIERLEGKAYNEPRSS